MPQGVRTVYVPEAHDSTPTFGAAATLTRVFRELIAGSPAVFDAPAPQAEAVVELSIDSVGDAAGVTGVAPPGQAAPIAKYAVSMVGSLRMFDRDASIIWQSGPVSVGEDYLAGLTDDPRPTASERVLSGTENNRRRAVERAAERLARELYARMVEGF